MCIDFYLLKKMFISLTTHLGSALECALYSHVPFGSVSHFQDWSCKDNNFKVSSAHWVIFRIQESHCLLVLWTPVKDWWQRTSLDWIPDSPSAQKTVNMAMAWSMYFSFFIFLSARWKCGINVEEVITSQSYFRHP